MAAYEVLYVRVPCNLSKHSKHVPAVSLTYTVNILLNSRADGAEWRERGGEPTESKKNKNYDM